jgi:RHS repeat-associated protein
VNYDGWGNRHDLSFTSGAVNTWAFTPDGTQLQSQTLSPVGASAIARPYAFNDPLNRLTRAGEWSLSYDSASRLNQATLTATSPGVPLPPNFTAGYSSDTFGNLTDSTGALPSPMIDFSLAVPWATNQIPSLAKNQAVTGWAANSNGEASTLACALGSGTPQIALGWDDLGRLVQAGYETFAYLPTGLRASRTDYNDASQNGVYAYTTGGQLLTEYRSGSARDIIYLGGLAIAEIDTNGVHELHSDHLGTPIMITSRTNGGVAEGWQYFGPYGELLQAQGYRPATGYTGHAQTDATGLIYMKGRFYSPVWHRFVNSDQGADPNQLNQYAYAGGNPMMVTDPSGMAGVAINSDTPPNPFSDPRNFDRSHDLRALKPLPEGDYLGPNVMYVGFSIATPLYMYVESGLRGLLGLNVGAQTNQGSGSYIGMLLAGSSYSSMSLDLGQMDGAVSTSGQSLGFTTMEGSQSSDPWVIQWQLSSPSPTGGWIVQNINSVSNGWPVDGFWEAWQVPAGSRHTDRYPASDDTFSGPKGVMCLGTARFYEGLTLPSSFQPGAVPTAGVLYSTTINPNLPTTNATAPVYRFWGF